MDLFATTSFFNLIAALSCFFAFLKMAIVIKGKKRESINIRYYFYALIFIAIYLLVGALPFLVIKNSYFIVVTTILFRPLLLVAGMFLVLITINLSRIKMIDSIYFYATVVVILFSSVLTIVGISNIGADYFFSANIESIMRPSNPLVVMGTLMTGLFFVISLLFATTFYVRFALRQRLNKIAFGKAVMMAIGSNMFLLAGLSKYIIGISAEYFVLTSTAASFLFMMGSVAFVSSVNYKGEKKKI